MLYKRTFFKSVIAAILAAFVLQFFLQSSPVFAKAISKASGNLVVSALRATTVKVVDRITNPAGSVIVGDNLLVTGAATVKQKLNVQSEIYNSEKALVLNDDVIIKGNLKFFDDTVVQNIHFAQVDPNEVDTTQLEGGEIFTGVNDGKLWTWNALEQRWEALSNDDSTESLTIDLEDDTATGILPTTKGGTGMDTFTENGVVFGNENGALRVTAAGTAGQVVLANSSGVPTFTAVSGAAQLSSTGTLTLNSGVVNTTTILDGTIASADIATNAAISFSKLNITKSDITGLGIPEEDTNTTYTAGTGIAINGSNQISSTLTGLPSCANGEVPQFNGADWECASIAGGTAYLAGTGLTLTGSTFSSDLGVAIDTNEITDNTITATDLNSTLSFADGDLIDFSSINASSTTEGLKLPQSTTCSSATAVGQLCWDSDDSYLYTGNGTSVTLVSNPFGVAIDSSEITDATISNTDIASDAAIPFSKLNIMKSDITSLGIPGEDTDTTYTAGTGLDLTDSVFSIATNVVTSNYGGSITATAFSGNGSALTNVTAAGIANDTITSAKIVDGTIANADISDDVLDWDKMLDSMTLDNATTISRSSTTNENSLALSYLNGGGTAGTDNVFLISNAVSSNASGDTTTEALLLLDQTDTTSSGTTALTNALLVTNSGGSTLTNAITIGSGSQVISKALNIASTGVTTDISLQNGETIDNDTDGTIAVSATTTSLSGGLKIGGGTTILNHYSSSGTIDVSSVSAASCATAGTVTVTGATTGDTVVVTPTPTTGGIETLALMWGGYVSATNTVTIRVCNPLSLTPLDPASQTWRVDVWHH